MIEEWRGFIQKRPDGSEIVNYNEPHFPVYIHKGHVYTGATWERDPHYHDDIEIIAVTRDHMRYSVNGKEIFLNTGDTILVNSRNIHYSIACLDEEARYIVYVFHPRILCSTNEVESKFIAPVTDNTAISYLHFTQEDEDGRAIHDVMMRMPDAIGNEFMITRQTFDIWDIIMKHIAFSKNSYAANYSDSHVDALKAMLAFIHNEYRNPITLDDIAKAGNVGRTFCNTLFHRYIGQTPLENVARFRVGKAAEILLNSNLSMSEIAELTGFSGASYMTETFKKYYGEAPRKYKNSQQGAER